ncbi:helix-turn-helix domain-containing protein [Streptomyces silvisoli]|uniref:Helix-turn-helix transcriptional regulator n=1 Tax=Streptomyces silvisoli TaxID=3034235 RepID=A0ABT5ZHP2_9ACTN|nr:helix-turn-helix transcriptional regulator [Streptomyces silvisoli]MDF3289333.1 helix-turn-helix transcriptional regulator [Streptomyces silvisoli]
MAAPKELDPTVSLAALLGKKLRKHRERLGWTQREVGTRLNYSHNRIAQVELGTDPPTWDMCVALDAALGAGGELTELWEHMVRERARENFPDYVQKFMLLEAKATKIFWYSPQIVPGVMQTEAYARAALRKGLPRASQEEIEEKVAARMSRQQLLRKTPPPFLWTVLDEAVIRRQVGGPHAMYDQLARIAELAESPDATVQVMPFTHGEYAIMGGSLALLSFADSPDVAYLEGVGPGVLEEEPDQVTARSLTYDHARIQALPPDASLTLIKTAMEECYACPRHDPI